MVVMVNTSVLKPSGTGFEWCINQYEGCAHGCRYCYGMTIRRKKYVDWISPKPRPKIIEDLAEDIRKLKASNALIKDIFLGSITDSYQPLENKEQITRKIIRTLIAAELPFTILTKSSLALRDLDLFRGYRQCRIGVTVTSLDANFRRVLEPFSDTYDARIKVLRVLKTNGIQTYLSCEPIFPVKEADPIAIVKTLRDFVDLFEFGMWNPYRKQGIPQYYFQNYSDDYYVRVFKEIIAFCEKEGINYCLASHSRDFVEEHGLPFKPYPLLREDKNEK